jgi:hypothetical protein
MGKNCFYYLPTNNNLLGALVVGRKVGRFKKEKVTKLTTHPWLAS